MRHQHIALRQFRKAHSSGTGDCKRVGWQTSAIGQKASLTCPSCVSGLGWERNFAWVGAFGCNRPKAVITVNRPLTQMQREQPSTIASRTAAIGQDRSYAVK